MTGAPTVFDPASMTVWDNPIVPPTVGLPVPIGTPLRELAPVTQSPLMLRLNGEWVLRDGWSRPACPGDVIEWHVLPMGGGGQGSRTVLTIVAMIAIAWALGPAGLALTGWQLAAATIAANLAAAALINALIPIQQAAVGGAVQSANSVYNVALSGNQARLYQPIPVIYGRMLTFPDYAGQPYTEFSDNDQYFYAVYCIGHGNFDVERLQIDDTPLDHFSDVQYEVLAPGSLPTIAAANVVTAPEVSGQEMISSQFIGGFAACGPTLSAAAIGIDIVFPRGLGLADSGGNIGNLSAVFKVYARSIDDFGTATGAWFTLGTETVNGATSTQKRVSFKYTLGTAGRVEVRIVRADVKNETINALHDMNWSGLRAYLSASATLCPTATHLALRVRASEQLSGLSQRKISGIWRRKLRTWSSGSGWGAEVFTRNPMWARLDKLTNNVYGDGLADSRIDLETHAELAAIYDERQDRLDILFDSKVTSSDADRTICMAGRAVPFQRAGVCTVVRDQLQTLPVTAFTSRDILPGSMNIGYALATETTADAVIVEYFNNRAWDWREVMCKAPGVMTPTNAVRQRVAGITGAKHAEREGLYLAAQNVYRRKFPKFQTEMQGLLPAYGSAAMFAPALPGWGQVGDVAFWDEATLTMGLTEPAEFTAGVRHYISIRRDDGSVTDAIEATPGPTAYDVVLASAPMQADGETMMMFTLNDATRERPKYVFGADGEHRIMVRVLGITKHGRGNDGAPVIEINSVAEDVRVHQVDIALLPGPGEIQDPIDGGGDGGGGDGGGGSLVIVNMTDHYVVDGGSSFPQNPKVTFRLRNDGTAAWDDEVVFRELTGEWMQFGQVETATAALYEVRLTQRQTSGNIDGSGNPGTGTFTGPAIGAWHNLGTTLVWSLQYFHGASFDQAYKEFKVEIREIANGIVQDTSVLSMKASSIGPGDLP